MHNVSRSFLNKTTPPSMFTLVALAAIAALPMGMFLPSLTEMALYFDTNYATIQLSVTLYLAFNAVFQFFIGPLSDRYGRRPITLICLIVFCIASIGAIFTTSVEMFLLLRMLQSSVVAGMILSRTAIRDMFDQNRAASMIGYVTMCMAVIPTIGPALGGVLQVHFGWTGSFWVMLGLGILVFILTFWDMGETNAHKNSSFRAQFQTYPELFTSHRFWAYCASAAFCAGAYFAYLGGANFVGAKIFGLPPDILGYYLATPSVGYIIGNGLSGYFSARIGINRMITYGAAISSFGIFLCLMLFIFTNAVPLTFYGSVILMGLGNGMTLPSATSGMMSVRQHLAGSASGIGGTIMTVGGAALAATAGFMLTPQSGAYPLIIIMLISSFIPILCITYIKRRERQLDLR